MAASSDIVVACLAENRPNWYRMVENLLISMRNFGGRLASADFIAYFVEGTDDVLAQRLIELGADLRVVARYEPTCPTTNKLRMFQDLAANSSASYLVALDCDVVIVSDFVDKLSSTAIQAMPAGHSPMTNEEWLDLLATLGLQAADRSTTMLATRQDVPAPYLNSGVVLVPAQYAKPLAESWTKYVDEFVAQKKAQVDKAWTGYLLDQVAFTCALLEQHIPVETLGPEMNLPTAIKLSDRVGDDEPDVGIIHYHKHITPDGVLRRTDSDVINRHIDKINAVIAARVGGATAPQPGPDRTPAVAALSAIRGRGGALAGKIRRGQ